jgi:hypothetical protein
MTLSSLYANQATVGVVLARDYAAADMFWARAV